MATRNGDLHAQVQELTTDIAVLEERAKGEKAAKELQAEEYERRLSELNQAHDRAEKVLATYVTIGVYDEAMKKLDEWRRVVDTERASNSGRSASYTALIAIVLGLAAIGAQIWSTLS